MSQWYHNGGTLQDRAVDRDEVSKRSDTAPEPPAWAKEEVGALLIADMRRSNLSEASGKAVTGEIDRRLAAFADREGWKHFREGRTLEAFADMKDFCVRGLEIEVTDDGK
ncbi:MAG: hypothetical protein IAF94_12610 [Pirellulaceae bacterium]|nr:hypothetical protein [Pirellulaceae bacterium]